MHSTVRPMSWNQMRESGFDPRPYAYAGLPTGSRRVVLEKAVWRPHPGLAVIWFMRDLESGQRYRISIFRDLRGQGYGPEGIDVPGVPVGTSLLVEIRQTRTGTYRVEGARVLSLPQA